MSIFRPWNKATIAPLSRSTWKSTRSSLCLGVVIVLFWLIAPPEARSCTFGNGTSLGKGWTVTPCGGGGSIGGGGGNIGAELEGAAAAVQAVGIAVDLLGDVLNHMPKASLDMPTLAVPTVSLPSLPSLPSAPSAAPAPRPRQSAQPQNDRAASCARMARIYRTSHAKMVTATQHLDDVDDRHPDKLCEFGRNVGLPLLQENVNAVSNARGEKCFGPADSRRLESFRKLLEDEKHAIGVDCKRAIEASVVPAVQPSRPASPQRSEASISHPAPTVPHIGQAAAANTSCPPAGPASYWQNTPNAAYCANANCVERGSAYYGMMCFPQNQASGSRPQPAQQQQAAVQPQAVGPIVDVNSLRAQQGSCSDITGLGGGSSPPGNCQSSGQQGPRQPTLAGGGLSRTVSAPAVPSPSAVTLNFSNAIQSLADAVDNTDDDELAARLRRRLEHTLADHRVPMKSQDYACLLPASATRDGRPKFIEVPLRWTEYDIKHEAIDRSHLCDNVAAGDAKDACRDARFGRAVMWAEPELAGLCRADGGPDHDIDKVAECAKRKFLNAWATNAGIVREAPPQDWSPSADCAASVPADQRRQAFRSHLRDRLRAALAAEERLADAGGGDSGNSGGGDTDQAAAPPSPPLAVTPPADNNDAYCSYMAREVVRGELTPGAGTPIPAECKAAIAAAEQVRKQQQASQVPPFSMSDAETDAEIRRLTEGTAVQNQ